MEYKAKPIYSKDKDNIIATKVKKNKLEKDFDGYCERMEKILGADKLKVEEYDKKTVIIYDKDKYSSQAV